MWRKSSSLRMAAIAIIAASLMVKLVFADALVVSKAMKASTIAEIFIEEQHVRVDLEIGAGDLGAFANILPDELHAKVIGRNEPFSKRLQVFLEENWVILSDGRQLSGRLEEILPAKRIVRDEVTGEPLAIEPENAELVIRVSLVYDLVKPPSELSIRPPVAENGVAANIGFVCYHSGLPVNDFRYLSDEFTVDLDWDDPWYSSFRHRNLRRQFDAPLSIYLYVEPYEVRKEIIIRPKDVEFWLDLGLDSGGSIPVQRQPELKERIAEFLADRNPVTVDGQEVTGRLNRVHFIHRSLNSTGIIEPPVDLKTVSATLGLIYVYPIAEMPEQVSMKCELFTPRIQSIPAVASDEAGGLPGVVTPDAPVLTWKNYLTNPSNTELLTVARPPAPPAKSVPLVSVCCGAVVIILLIVVWRQWRAGRRLSRFVVYGAMAAMVVGVLLLPVPRFTLGNPFANRLELTEQETSELLQTLLHNVYRSFEHHDEQVIYDRLARSIAGELLSDVYLQTRRSMEVKNQGGLRISVKEVEVTEFEPNNEGASELAYRCRWRVRGWIGHWGHVHARQNEHVAMITIADRDGRWKITAMEMLDQSPADSTMDLKSIRRGEEA